MNEEQDSFIKCIKQYNNILAESTKTIIDLKTEIIQLTNLLEEKYNEVVEDDLPF